MPCSRLVTAIAFALALSHPALAQMKVRVGQPQAGTFQFVALQVANEAGIFKQHGIEVEIVSFGGGPPDQQALPSESLGIAIGPAPQPASPATGAPNAA